MSFSATIPALNASAPSPVFAYGANSSSEPLHSMTITRRPVGAGDVEIEIYYCGICHSDIHVVHNELGAIQSTHYPCVPGHEIVGKVTKIGQSVKSVKIGEIVGVGCLIDSCANCSACSEGEEQFCEKGWTLTYNSLSDKEPAGYTMGGYSQRIIIKQECVLHITHSPSQLAAVAPLLCAGITTYSPLKHWNAGKGKKVGIVGIGGLGHMGIKLSHALGAYTVALTTNPKKREQALKLGADLVIISKNEEEMKQHLNSFDLILDSISASHNLDTYTQLLRRDGTLCLLGVAEQPHPSPNTAALIFGRKSIAGSLIGGIKETQEMLDFCAKQGIVADIELIPAQKINEAYERMIKGDVQYRFVIDNKTLGK